MKSIIADVHVLPGDYRPIFDEITEDQLRELRSVNWATMKTLLVNMYAPGAIDAEGTPAWDTEEVCRVALDTLKRILSTQADLPSQFALAEAVDFCAMIGYQRRFLHSKEPT